MGIKGLRGEHVGGGPKVGWYRLPRCTQDVLEVKPVRPRFVFREVSGVEAKGGGVGEQLGVYGHVQQQ